MSFTDEYVKTLTSAAGAYITNNYDEERFGKEKKNAIAALSNLIHIILFTLGIVTLKRCYQTLNSGVQKISENISDLEWIYNKLSDNQSKELLVRIVAYRALGYKKIILPVNNKKHWESLRKAKRILKCGDRLYVGFMEWFLTKGNLKEVGFPIDIYINPSGIVIDFIEEQYRCSTDIGNIECEKGDFVIDGGACWGDTALYFGYLTGDTGRVASFEFLESNIKIFNENIGLNPNIKKNNILIQKPLWSKSGRKVEITPMGPGTSVKENKNREGSEVVETISIDDVVEGKILSRVDFIKLDIEGSELEALKGAINTLSIYKPKLAITVYHNFQDLWTIAQYIDNLKLGYKFYLRHYTIHSEETVLFAKVF